MRCNSWALRESRSSSPARLPGPTRSRRETRRWISASAACSPSTRPCISTQRRRRRTSCSRSTPPGAWAPRSRMPGTTRTGFVSDIQASIPGARFAVADFKDYSGLSTATTPGCSIRISPQQPRTPACSGVELIVSPIQCALNGLSAQPGSGGDNAEAYNRAFFEAYSDPNLHWADGASRFMIVLGDSLPHDATMNTDFPDCPNTPPTDLGRTLPLTDDLRTQPTLTALKQSTTRTFRSSRTTRPASRGAALTTLAASPSSRSTRAAALSITAPARARSRTRSSA